MSSSYFSQIGVDIDGESAGDSSGFSVSLSSDGSIVAIGAYQNDGNGNNSGHVRIYQNVSGTWTQIGDDIDGEAASPDGSGNTVSLSDDGTTVAIGDFLGNESYSGQTRIFKKNPTLSDSTPADNATAVATDSNIVLNFSEAVDYGSGNIVIYKASDDSEVETIRITSANVLSSGAILTTPDVFDFAENAFTVNYSETVPEIASALGVSESSKTAQEWASFIETNYDIILNGGSHSYTGERVSISGQRYETDGHWLGFTTDPDTKPDLGEGSFNGGVQGADGTLTFITKTGSTQYIINPSSDLEEQTSYYVQIDATAFDDASGNSYAGISDTTTLSFTTRE